MFPTPKSTCTCIMYIFMFPTPQSTCTCVLCMLPTPQSTRTCIYLCVPPLSLHVLVHIYVSHPSVYMHLCIIYASHPSVYTYLYIFMCPTSQSTCTCIYLCFPPLSLHVLVYYVCFPNLSLHVLIYIYVSKPQSICTCMYIFMCPTRHRLHIPVHTHATQSNALRYLTRPACRGRVSREIPLRSHPHRGHTPGQAQSHALREENWNFSGMWLSYSHLFKSFFEFGMIWGCLLHAVVVLEIIIFWGPCFFGRGEMYTFIYKFLSLWCDLSITCRH